MLAEPDSSLLAAHPSLATVSEPFVQGPVVTVVLHGALGEKYGRRHKLGVSSAPEAAHALCQLVPGFKDDFQDGWYRVVRGKVRNGVALDERSLGLKVPHGGEIHFIPRARGGKHSGTAKMVVGAVILVAAVVASSGALAPVFGATGTSAFVGAASAASAGGGFFATAAAGLGTTATIGGMSLGVTWGSIAFFGATMLISGMAALLSSTSTKTVDSKTSYGFSGQTNSALEGSVLPVVYGRTRVGSVVGSFGYSAEDYYVIASGGTGNNSYTYSVASEYGGSAGVGSGSSKGGSSSGASEADNTLRSKAVVRVIDILSEGPIGGLVNGAKSIFFNNTPLMASDGSYNFQGVSWEIRLGYPDQDPVSGYSAAEQTIQVGVQVQALGSGPITRTYTSSTATTARVTIRIPALYSQSSSNGNIGTFPSLQYKIEARPAGTSSWTLGALETFIGQKCTSAYQKSYRFPLPQAGSPGITSWDIRVTRLTADPTSSSDQCDTWWDLTTLVTDQKLAYPNVAYMALTLDAASFGTSIPTRNYELDGVLVQVPANYDPVARTYATSGTGTVLGTWDGATWKLATTSNPAWCCYDMFSNARYGMGLPTGVLTYTRFDLYPIAQYADGNVPSGFKDGSNNDIMEPRYALNVQLNTQSDAYTAIQSFVSAFRGMSFWGAGRVVVTADMPTVPSTVTTQANVVSGEFQYEGSALKSRHTIVRVSWLDPGNSYQETIEVVEDFDAVVTQGQISVDIMAFGTTSRGLARRWGKWLLDTEKTQTELVSYAVGLEHLRVRPGDVTRIADRDYAGVRMGGRCLPGCTTTQIFIDDFNFVFDSGQTWTMSVTLPTYSTTTTTSTVADAVAVSGFSRPGGISCITLAHPLPVAPDTDSTWVLQSSALATRQFRILALAEPQRGQYQVSGVFHDPNKYARVEFGLKFDPLPYSTLNSLLAAPLPGPTNVFAKDYITGVGTTTIVRATVSWTSANDPRVIGTQVRAQGPEQRDMNPTAASSIDIDGLQLGTYVFRARSVGRDGRASAWVDSPSVVVDGIGDAAAAPTALTATGDAMSVQLTWTAAVARDVLHYEIWRVGAPGNGSSTNPINGWNISGLPSANGASLLATIDGTSYLDQGLTLGPSKAWAYWVRAVSTTLVNGSFAGPAKAQTTIYLTNNLEEAIRNTAPYAQSLLGSAPVLLNDLTTPGTIVNQLGFNRADQKLYKWNGSSWIAYIPLIPDTNGQLTAAQIASIDLSRTVGSLSQAQNDALVAAIGTAKIQDGMIAALTGSKVNGALSNATIAAGALTEGGASGINTARLIGQITSAQLPAVIAASKLQDTDPGSGQTVSGLAYTKLLGQLTASYIAAGAIDTTKLSVVSPTNFIANSCWAMSATSGWRSSTSGPTQTLTPIIGSTAATLWAPGEADGGLWVTSAALPQNGWIDIWTSPKGNNGRTSDAAYPVVVGSTYEAQVRFISGNSASSVIIVIDWINSSGALISGAVSSTFTPATPANGLLLANWSIAVIRGVAPAGAVYASVRIRVTNTTVTSTIPTAYFTQALLGLSIPNSGLSATNPTLTWVPGGVTSIDGANVQTGTLFARAIAANQIGAQQLAVGNSANAISNSCFALTTEGWTVGLSNASGSVASCATTNTAYQTADGVGCIVAASMAANGVIDLNYYGPNTPAIGVTCAPGDTLEAQAMLLPIGNSAQIYIRWISATGTQLSTSALSAAVPSQPTPTAALQGTLSPFVLCSLIATAPAGLSPPVAGAVLVVRAQNGASPVTNTTTFITRTALGKTFAGATQVSTWAPGGITSIGGGIIATNAVVARHVATGALDTTKLQVAGPGNVIGNPTCEVSAWGWQKFFAGSSLGTVSLGSITGDGLAPSAYALAGEGSGVIVASGSLVANGSDALQVYWDPNGIGGIPCNGNEWWEAQAYLGPQRCYGYVVLQFWNSAGTLVGSGTGNRIASTSGQGGNQLGAYGFSWVKAQAPATAVRVTMVMVAANDGGADIQATKGSNPFLFFTRCLLGLSNALTQAQGALPQPYTIGGSTSIQGGAIRTLAIAAKHVSAGAIDASKMSIASATNVISNSCFTIGPAGWSGGPAAWASNSPWALSGFGTGYFTIASLAWSAGGVTGGDVAWAPNGNNYAPDGTNAVVWGAATPCSPGDIWEAQALAQTHRCGIQIYVLYMAQRTSGTGAGAWDYVGGSSSGTQSWVQPADGKSESAYHLISIRATAPTAAQCDASVGGGTVHANGATLCTVMLRMIHDATSGAVWGNTTQANPYLMFTQVGLAQIPAGMTIFPASGPAIPWSPGGSTQIDGGTLKTGSILSASIGALEVKTANLDAGAVNTAKLAAGSVTAAQMAIGDPSNYIWNSTVDLGVDGWAITPYGGSSSAFYVGPTGGTGYGASWYLLGTGSAIGQYTSAVAITSSQGIVFDWVPTPGSLNGVPCVGGRKYGGAALLAAGNGASAYVALFFLNGAGAQTGTQVYSTPAVTTNVGGATLESQYTRATVIATAPADAVSVVLRIQMVGGGAQQPFMVWSKAQLMELPANATALGPWTPGGVTTISGQMIKTGSLDANRINVSTLTAGTAFINALTATTVTAGTITAVLVGTNKLTADHIDVNTMSVGALTGTASAFLQIAAGSLHATMLASDFALVNSAQIGSATIQNANIADLTLNGEKLVANAVSIVAGLNNYTNAYPADNGGYTYTGEADFIIGNNNAGGIILYNLISDYASAYTSYEVTAGGGDTASGAGGNYQFTAADGNIPLLRFYVTPPGGSQQVLFDFVPDQGVPSPRVNGTQILPPLNPGFYQVAAYCRRPAAWGGGASPRYLIRQQQIAVITWKR